MMCAKTVVRGVLMTARIKAGVMASEESRKSE
jgi:hypothetical protein